MCEKVFKKNLCRGLIVTIFVVLLLAMTAFCLSSCKKSEDTTDLPSVIPPVNDRVISDSGIEIRFDETNGCCNFYYNDTLMLANVSSLATDSQGGSYASSGEAQSTVAGVTTELGEGKRLTVTVGVGETLFVTEYTVYNGKKYVTVGCGLKNPSGISTNYLVPLQLTKETNGEISFCNSYKLSMLSVPYGNDGFSRYSTSSLFANKDFDELSSNEVTALFNTGTRNAIIIGSIRHDVFKSKIICQKSDNTVNYLKAYSGAADESTGDVSEAHGFISGTEVSSPEFLVGFYEDYLNGMESYGEACAAVSPPLKWTGGTVVGWNSWGGYGKTITYEDFIKASDFYADNFDFGEKKAYINFDSYWDNLTEEQLIAAAAHAHANGQLAGIYWTPFVLWWNGFDYAVDGTDGKYKYRDIILKDSNGEFMKLEGSNWTLDPSHPGTQARIKYQMAKFVEWGYDYVKLDFMYNGAQEGVHYDPAITTGVQAYNAGMKCLAEQVTKEKIGRDFFISLSIAPLFPSQYAHARRISCDVFQTIENTEYVLNNLTYGWWQNGNVYAYTDPDHVILNSPFFGGESTESEAVARFNSAVISGTVLLGGDRIESPATERMIELFGNKELLALAEKGEAFRPKVFMSGSVAANTFYLKTSENEAYVAIFNYSAKKAKTKVLLSDIGLSSGTYRVRNLNTGTDSGFEGDTFSIELEGKSSYIFKLTK